jgi:hypothetical protein
MLSLLNESQKIKSLRVIKKKGSNYGVHFGEKDIGPFKQT